jgi:hypothetical protein
MFSCKEITDSTKECHDDTVKKYSDKTSLRVARTNPTSVCVRINIIKISVPYNIWNLNTVNR